MAFFLKIPINLLAQRYIELMPRCELKKAPSWLTYFNPLLWWKHPSSHSCPKWEENNPKLEITHLDDCASTEPLQRFLDSINVFRCFTEGFSCWYSVGVTKTLGFRLLLVSKSQPDGWKCEVKEVRGDEGFWDHFWYQCNRCSGMQFLLLWTLSHLKYRHIFYVKSSGAKKYIFATFQPGIS